MHLFLYLDKRGGLQEINWKYLGLILCLVELRTYFQTFLQAGHPISHEKSRFGTCFVSRTRISQCTPWFNNLKRRADRFIKSKADLKSMKHVYKGRPLALHLSMIPFSKKILSMAPEFGLNPFWNGSPMERHSFASWRRLFKMPTNNFPGVIVILR